MQSLSGLVDEVLGAVFVGGLLVTWLKGFFNQFLPSPPRTRCALANVLQTTPPPREDGFRIVLCWLENDPSGSDTRNVAQAFTGLDGITLARSARIVAASGAGDDWRPAMRQKTRAVLDVWNADLAVVGLVKRPGKVLSLWFLPRLGEGTLRRGDDPYTLEHVTLGDDFHDDLVAQITATTLTSVAPLADNEARGLMVQTELQAITEKLSKLLDGGTIDKGDRRPALQMAYANALAALGERDKDTARLKEAVEAFRAMLEEHPRASVPLDWARTQNNLGNALSILGERESATARLEEAVEAYRAALEEHTRARVPLAWARTQGNLGNALLSLGERESATARLEEAVEAYRAALGELSRAHTPLTWASTQNNLGNAFSILGRATQRYGAP